MYLRYSESDLVGNQVFRSDGLVRTRLTSDASKLIMSTTGGYLIVVHELDLATLQADLQGFQPNIYRLMQKSDQVLRWVVTSFIPCDVTNFVFIDTAGRASTATTCSRASATESNSSATSTKTPR